MKNRILLALIVATAPSAVLALQPATSAPSQDAGAKFRRIYEAEWKWRTNELALGPQGTRGSGGERLPDVTPAAQERRLQYWTGTLAELDRLPVDQLSAEDKINFAVLRTSLQQFVHALEAREYEMPFISGTSFWGRLAPRAGFRTAQEYRYYILRMRDVPRFFDENIANMRAGLLRGFTPPRITIVGRDRTIEPFADPDLSKNPFYQAFAQMPTNIPAAEQEALRNEGREVISQIVVPAFGRLLPFIRDEYIPKSRSTLAAEALPDGKTYYATLVRDHTTLDLTPRQIHDIGLKEVARIRGEMDIVMRKSGWTGTFADYLTFLKTDPQFVAETPYDLLARATFIINKVNGKLGETIGLLPRHRFAILPTPAAIAPFGTGGNGGLDSCVFNTYNLPARKLYTLPALAVHECAPGHSFQAAVALEGPKRPQFRRSTSFTGYGEGWGLYTEYLGIGMGVYQTPYEDFGRLTYEMWRAARLVIDTGVHHLGWSREKAIAYLASNTALADHEVEMEIDRYVSNPGQALAYKLGEMLIRRKRAEAEAKLGAKFDQRWFHDAILDLGSVPLPVLEQQIDLWIAAGGKNPHATS
jgi:uncharacterized protein (DUF885 family)